MMLRPRSGGHQWIAKEEYKISQDIPVYEFTDIYGNLCQRFMAQPGLLEVRTKSQISVPDILFESPGAFFIEIQNLPDYTLCYLLPSRYCESDRFNQMAHSIVYGCFPGFDQVAAIEHWLRYNISYLPGTSDYPISAIEVNERQSGVCRDLAHLGIALCRSLGIPARLVVGYLLDLEPMDMHAWFEAYVGGCWYTFDATQMGVKKGYVVVGYGRDASDVAIYNQFGMPVFPYHYHVAVEDMTIY